MTIIRSLPPRSMLPPELARLADEARALGVKLAEQRVEVQRLAQPGVQQAAEQRDAEAAAAAARAGKVLPEPKFVIELTKERREADYRLGALHAALEAVGDDVVDQAAAVDLSGFVAAIEASRKAAEAAAAELEFALGTMVAQATYAAWLRRVKDTGKGSTVEGAWTESGLPPLGVMTRDITSDPSQPVDADRVIRAVTDAIDSYATAAARRVS